MKYICPVCGNVLNGQPHFCPVCATEMAYPENPMKVKRNKKVNKQLPQPVNNVTPKKTTGTISKVEINKEVNKKNIESNGKSYFDGGLLQKIGWLIVGFFITVLTIGICYPLALCLMYKWEVKHTVIEGHRLGFDGRAIQLLGNWIKWLLLSLITLLIFALWIPIKLKKWITKHTYFAD